MLEIAENHLLELPLDIGLVYSQTSGKARLAPGSTAQVYRDYSITVQQSTDPSKVCVPHDLFLTVVESS